MIKIENWCGYNIRFIEINGEWWAILKDICDALKLRTDGIAQRLRPEMLERVKVAAPETKMADSNPVEMGLNIKMADSTSLKRTLNASDLVSNNLEYEHIPVTNINKAMMANEERRKPGDWKTHWMLAVNELGIYEALFASRRLEARKFRMWAGTVMQKLRTRVGLQGYEVMRMTDKDIQDEIDDILDTLFWDEEKKCVMQSVTVQGGDVEQVPFAGL